MANRMAEWWRSGLAGRVVLMLMLVAASLPVAGQDAKCRNPDPTSFDEVFACMSSFRYEKGMAKGVNVFERNIDKRDCRSIAIKYLHAVRGSSPIREELAKLLPSCKIFAQTVEAFTGKPPFWATCTDYPGKFDPGHMRVCLTEFIPRFYGGNRAPGQVKGCQGILEDYERALLAASGVTIEGRALRHKLPPGYVRPSCEAVADIFAAADRPLRSALAQSPAPRPHLIRTASTSAWKQCLGFTPDNAVAHVSQCLGNDIARTSDCRSVRQLYEEKLQQAYGGEFPPDYVTIPCAQLNAVLEEHQKRVAAARAETIPPAVRPPRSAPSYPSSSGLPRPSEGWMALIVGSVGQWAATVGMGQPHVWAASLFHGLLIAWSLLYARRRYRTNEWIWPIEPQSRYLFQSQRFRIKLRGVHGLLIVLGVWQTGWGWISWALVTIVAGKSVAWVLTLFHAFDNDPYASGRVEQRMSFRPRLMHFFSFFRKRARPATGAKPGGPEWGDR